MQSPCRNRSGRAVTALAENKALRGKNPRQISVFLLSLSGIFRSTSNSDVVSYLTYLI